MGRNGLQVAPVKGCRLCCSVSPFHSSAQPLSTLKSSAAEGSSNRPGLLHSRPHSPTPGVRLNHGLVPCPFHSNSSHPTPSPALLGSLWLLAACGLNGNHSSLQELLTDVLISLGILPHGSQSLFPESCQHGPNVAGSDRSHGAMQNDECELP